MQKIRIFNPEHDLALAFGGTNYTPPPMARLLHRDLQMLPYWFSNSGDTILTENPETDEKWIESMNDRFHTGVKVDTVSNIGKYNDIEPWGWNRFLWHRLRLSGVPDTAIPTESTIEDIRRLSHRRISIDIHRLFLDNIPSLQDNTPVELDNMPDIHDFARRNPRAYVKAPWSSSGKGIYRALDIVALDFNRWCSGILKRQGSLLCEKPLSAVLDFAMEFRCNNGQTEFIGYSIFNNDTQSSFSGGLLMSTDRLHDKIVSTLGDEKIILKVRDTAIEIINKLIAPYYSGYAGIDMMIYTDSDGELRINPCIELNLRTTMGVVSSIIGNRFLAEGSTGTFHVEFHKKVIDESFRRELEQQNPINITSEGKIKSGVQFLTPLYPASQYAAYIIVNS